MNIEQMTVGAHRAADRGETPLPQKLLIFDELAKNRKIPLFVIPVKTGHAVQFFKLNGATLSAIQLYQMDTA